MKNKESVNIKTSIMLSDRVVKRVKKWNKNHPYNPVKISGFVNFVLDQRMDELEKNEKSKPAILKISEKLLRGEKR